MRILQWSSVKLVKCVPVQSTVLLIVVCFALAQVLTCRSMRKLRSQGTSLRPTVKCLYTFYKKQTKTIGWFESDVILSWGSWLWLKPPCSICRWVFLSGWVYTWWEHMFWACWREEGFSWLMNHFKVDTFSEWVSFQTCFLLLCIRALNVGAGWKSHIMQKPNSLAFSYFK